MIVLAVLLFSGPLVQNIQDSARERDLTASRVEELADCLGNVCAQMVMG